MKRFVVIWADDAWENKYPGFEDYEGKRAEKPYDHYNILYETDGVKPIREVGSDFSEPEDARLTRSFDWVVTELNKLADESQANIENRPGNKQRKPKDIIHLVCNDCDGHNCEINCDKPKCNCDIITAGLLNQAKETLSEKSAYDNFFDIANTRMSYSKSLALSIYLNDSLTPYKSVLLACLADSNTFCGDEPLLTTLSNFVSFGDRGVAHPAALAMYHGGEKSRLNLKVRLSCMDNGIHLERQKDLMQLLNFATDCKITWM